jgi:nitrogen regulatory protein P-II 1
MRECAERAWLSWIVRARISLVPSKHWVRRLLRAEVWNVKKVVAILQPNKFDAVKEALSAIGIDGLTAIEARGFGRQKGHREVFRGREYQVDLLPKIQLEVVVPSTRVDDVVQALTAAARTGQIGDGKIFVYDIEEAFRIRNSERGDLAL